MKAFFKKFAVLDILVVFLGLFLLGWSFFYDMVRYDQFFPPGDDAIRHMTIAQKIIQTGGVEEPAKIGTLDSSLTDVPVFHILLSSVSLATGMPMVSVTMYFMRGLMVFITLLLYVMVRKWTESRSVALFAFLLLVFFSPSLTIIFAEGTYLDLYAGSILLPAGLFFLVHAKDVKKFIVANIFFLGIFLSHPLTATGLFVILGLLHILILSARIFFKKNIFPVSRLLLLDAMILLGIALSWNFYSRDIVIKVFGLFKFLVVYHGDVAKATGALNYLPQGFSVIPSYDIYAHFLHHYTVYIGILGVALLWKWPMASEKKLILFVWMFGLFLASRTSVVQLPIRFARDLYLPAPIFAGIALAYYFQGAKKYFGMRALSVLFFVFMLLAPLKDGFLGERNYVNGALRVQEPDRKAIEWIRENTDANDIFLGSPSMSTPWGSFITLLTGRVVFDCGYDNIIEFDNDILCSSIFRTETLEAEAFYRENRIAYVYGGKPFVGDYVWKEVTPWNHYTYLENTPYLEKVFDFRDGSGRVVIYKVQKNKFSHDTL